MSCETRRMFVTARGGALHGDIFQRRIKFGELTRAEIQNVPGKAPNSRARLGHDERARRAEKLPHFRELPRDEAPKDRMHVDTCVVVPKPACTGARVIAVNGMIEAFTHEVGEGDWAAHANSLGKNFGKSAGVLSRLVRLASGAEFGGRSGRHTSWRCGLHVNISMMKS